MLAVQIKLCKELCDLYKLSNIAKNKGTEVVVLSWEYNSNKGTRNASI
jgi:hypothetical protein